MRSNQYSNFVEVFNCLIALETHVDGNEYTYSIEVPFEKAAPLPFWRFGTPDYGTCASILSLQNPRLITIT